MSKEMSKGILFKPDVLKAKLKVLGQYGEAVTRRLGGLKEINKEPDAWELFGSEHSISDGGLYFVFGFHTKTRMKEVKPRYQVGEVVYIKETYKSIDFDLRTLHDALHRVKVEYKDGATVWVMKPAKKLILIPDKWHSTMMMPAWAARYFLKITDVEAERLIVAELSLHEIELEGGEPALKILHEIDGKWVFRYTFKLVKPEQERKEKMVEKIVTIPLYDSSWAIVQIPVPMSEENWDLFQAFLNLIKGTVVEPLQPHKGQVGIHRSEYPEEKK